MEFNAFFLRKADQVLEKRSVDKRLWVRQMLEDFKQTDDIDKEFILGDYGR